MDRRFTALRVIGTVFKILGWISLILGLLAAVGALIAGLTMGGQEWFGFNLGGPLAAIAAFIVALIISIFNFLALYAVGDAIYLALAIEENTRRSAYMMQQQYMAYQPPYPAQPGVYDEG
ncbi:MAG TPA: hypothetical protein VLC95_16810 [Anaerolineae bacterium]|jgi:hypothetical protein|nr:hypothetical protein [Anaerolineae bacterium]